MVRLEAYIDYLAFYNSKRHRLAGAEAGMGGAGGRRAGGVDPQGCGQDLGGMPLLPVLVHRPGAFR